MASCEGAEKTRSGLHPKPEISYSECWSHLLRPLRGALRRRSGARRFGSTEPVAGQSPIRDPPRWADLGDVATRTEEDRFFVFDTISAPVRRTLCLPIAAGALTIAAFAAPASAAPSPHPALPLFDGPAGASLLPNGATAGNLLATVAVSADDVWTFGYSNAEGGDLPAYARHFDGHAWTTVDIPTPSGAIAAYPYAATAFGPNDIWVVGHSEDAGDHWSTLTEHWDGTSWWIVASPNQSGADDSYLYAVSGTSSDDLWAVGTGLVESSGVDKTFALHWNGTEWSVVDTPAPSAMFSELNGVAAIAPDNVWAVGSYQSSSALPSLVEHWNGKKWRVSSPNEEGAQLTQFGPLVAFGADDIWSIGYESNASGLIVPQAAHYNGKRWTLKAMENPSDSFDAILLGAGGSGPDDLWGTSLYINSSFVGLPLIEHFNGKKWKIVNAPQPPSGANSQLTGVAAPTSSDA